MTEVAEGVFVHTGVHEDIGPGNDGDIANIGFVVGGKGVAVIDTGNTPALGRRLRAAVRERTRLPILYVINTHVHPDHIFGNAAFREEGPQFVGHAKLAQAMSEKAPYYLRTLKTFLGEESGQGVEVVPPTVTVKAGETVELDLGSRKLTLNAFAPAHTYTDVTVLDVNTGTLWAGDLLFVERVPSLDGSLPGWLRTIEILKQIPATRAIPGHGPASAEWPQALAAEERYLNVLLRDVRASLKAKIPLQRALDSAGAEEKGKWVLFDDYNGRNVSVAYRELEWE